MTDWQSTRRFSDRVESYARYRPGYPDALVPELEARAGLRPGSLVADLGAGTGKSVEPFLRAGYSVVAVEPNGEMRAAMEATFGGERNLRIVDGRAEATGLDDASVDTVFAGQAFHWFDLDATRREVRRIVRPGGLCILAWYERKDGTPDADRFEIEYDAILRLRCPDYAAVRSLRDFDVDRLGAFFHPARVERMVLEHDQQLDRQGLVGRVLSGSYTPLEGPGHDALLVDLDALFDRHAVEGKVTLHYETRIYFGAIA